MHAFCSGLQIDNVFLQPTVVKRMKDNITLAYQKKSLSTASTKK